MKKERAALAGLSAAAMDAAERSDEASMAELWRLAETAGAEPVCTLLQTRDKPEPRTFLGTGKVEELKELAENEECSLVIFDNDLSPSQARVLEELLGVRVMDRTGLILDIFAQRAHTREGKLQVELAQYQYLLPRLTGMWTHLKRQAGTSAPIGTRGPGETQLETDRRHIRRRIQKLTEELEQVRRVRNTQRRRREKNVLPVVALVGYTNAGKSTLLNALTGDCIQTGDRLFDTLDTTTRRIALPGGGQALLSDTVGFIRKLPTELVDAFKATLEELTYADLLLHVIDISNPEYETQAQVVDELIDRLGAGQTPCLRVYNKCDAFFGRLPSREDEVCVCARTGEGTATLLHAIEKRLEGGLTRVRLLIPYTSGALVTTLETQANVLELTYREEGTEVLAVVGPELLHLVAPYQIHE
ncbi:MAG: GTPase HflX [Oscillospiraceae bacterium]|nr:GTPase HflX [Oscillospiraceae bacterium]MCD7749337.1 GTPase HflX [Oscillospiraceae bacterium]